MWVMASPLKIYRRFAENLQIDKAKVAALAAYQKKSLFGPSKIKATRLEVTQTPKHYLIQKGSSATIEGEMLREYNLT